MSDPTETVRAGVDDIDELAGLFREYRAFYRQPDDGDRERAFLLERLGNDESVVFLARVGGEPAGFVQLYPTWSSVNLVRKWVLNDLYVAERFRRRHVALELMGRSVEFVRDTGAGRLDLKTGVENTAARRLYEMLGWELDTAFCTYVFPLIR